MKTALCAVLLLAVLCASAHGQQTTFKNHHLGEDFATWASTESINMNVMCTKPSRDNKASCQRLARVRGGEELDFSTTDGKSNSTFYFHAGTVAQIRDEDFMVGSDFQERVVLLTQKYGAPKSAQTLPYQNALGAKWLCGQAAWSLPDGVVVIATESIENLPNLGPTRKLTIIVASKADVEKFLTGQNKANPY